MIAQLVAVLPFVVLPYAVQARESLHPPMNTPSLGTFGVVMSAAVYFTVVGLINGIIASSRLGWPWYGGLGLGLVAASVGAVASYSLLYTMALKGGVVITVAGGLGLILLSGLNILGPRML
jgi:hypothetical protein